MKVAQGCSTLGDCVLTTLTLNAQRTAAQGGDEETVTAQYVGAEWRRLLYHLKKSLPQLAWLKVTQLTKRGTPHLHVVMGNLNGRVARCEKDVYKNLAWSQARCKVDCLEHEVARLWLNITTDSWVVDVRPVVGPAGAGAYLGRYLATDFLMHSRLVELGYHRRYNRSRNWPHERRMEYEATARGEWHLVERLSSPAWKNDEVAAETPVARRIWPRVGTAMAARYERRARIKAGFARMRSLEMIGWEDKNGPASAEDPVLEDGGAEHG